MLNFLIKPFWIFGIDRTVQNTIAAEDYGIYFTLFNFSMLFNILLDFGITNFNNRNIAQHRQLLSKYFSGIVVFKFLLAIFYFAITFIVGLIVGYDSTRFQILFFLSINQFLISFLQYLRSNIAGLQLFVLDSLFSVLDKTLMIGLCAVLIWGHLFEGEFTIMQFIYAQTLAYLLAVIIVFLTVLIKAKKFKFQLNIPFLILIIKQTAPYALLVLTMTIYYRLDVIMIDYMLEDGEYQSSVYAQAYRLMDASNQVGVLFAGLLLPMFAFMIQKKEKLDKLIKLSFGLLFIPAIVLAFISFSYAKDIMTLLYHTDVHDATKVLPVLMFCFVAIASTYIFGTLLTANGNLKQLNILAISGMTLNIILNIILIPSYKALGSAIASLITQFVVLFAQVFLVKIIFNLRLNQKFILSLISFVSLLFITVWVFQNIELNFIVKVISISVFALGFSIILRIINLKNMVELLLKRGTSE
ncbi:MAG: polysaccharide biosynthesis C-terminal domain-containing protein [Flavobacteriales bacterium]|nr:polysaccharide biosynthesis C-terminal domain-containing protein [Flavobacteriales bacterium]MCB9363324.1 polysaccharide biosynthesis C-terminal domain-containing protein [Flavobacteriales bacterium]